MMNLLFFLAFITSVLSDCEDYGEKVTEGWESSSLARDDPCFGYDYDCCTDTYSEYCYWKDTYNCNNCELDIGYGSCSACCDSYDNPTPEPTAPTAEPTEKPVTSAPVSAPTAKPTAEPTPAPVSDEPTPNPTPKPVTSAPVTAAPVATPAPTVHSAKKWTMLHPNYEGGDGELLWNVYYGDYAEDPRFDDFRQQQLWDVEVIRPLIEEDVKYARFQLNHQIDARHGKSSVLSHHWLMMAAAAMVVMAVFALWMNRRSSYSKIVDSETQPLVATYGH